MNPTENHLNHLFEVASTEPPSVTFDEIQASFTAAVSGSIFMTFKWWLSSMLTGSKPFIIIAVIGVTIPAIVYFYYNNTSKENTTLLVHQEKVFLSELNKNSKPAILTNIEPEVIPVDEISERTKNVSLKPLIFPPLTFNKKQSQLIYDYHILPQKPFKPMFFISPIEPMSLIKGIALPQDRGIYFTITEMSPERDFSKIQRLAKKAGIEMTFRVHHYRKNDDGDIWLLQDCSIEMQIPDQDKDNSILVNVPKLGKFSVTFGWYEDAAGTVTNLSPSQNITQVNSFHTQD